ncbi:MAG: hypothetical protein ABI433_11000 [Burkholderiaceae bacterium]
MRPRGEVREALASAASALALEREQGAATWRQIAARAQVGYSVAHDTIRNMARAGELADVGAEQPPGSARLHRLYRPAQRNFATATTGSLDQVVRGWRAL